MLIQVPLRNGVEKEVDLADMVVADSEEGDTEVTEEDMEEVMAEDLEVMEEDAKEGVRVEVGADKGKGKLCSIRFAATTWE